MTATKRNLNVMRANDVTLTFPHDLGVTPTFAKICWRYGGSGPIYLCKRSDDTPSDFTLSSTQVIVRLHVTDTEALPLVPYNYDVTVVANGNNETIAYGLAYLLGGSTEFTVEEWPNMLGALVTSAQKDALDAAPDLSASNPVASQNWTSGKFQRLRVGFKTVTINSGEVTVNTDGDHASFYTLRAQSGTTDTLQTINGGTEGDVIIINAYPGHTITLTPGGNISLHANVDIGDKYSRVLVFSSNKWRDTVGSVGYANNSDMVDDRHAAPERNSNLSWVDVHSIAIANGWVGWLPIAYGNNWRSGVISVAEGWNGRHNVWSGEIHARFGKGYIRELVSHRYYMLTIHAVRVVADNDNATYGQHVVQVYVSNSTGSTVNLLVYQRHDFAGFNSTQPWTLGYCPNQVPSNVRVVAVQGAGNGSWKLERALTGSSAPVGYMTPADKQATFAFYQSDWWTDANDDGLLDGDTGARAGDKLETDDQVVYIIYKANEPITLDKIKSSFVYTALGNDVAMAVEASDDASNWTSLGYVVVQDNSPTAELTFSATRALYWKVKFHVYAGGSGWSVGVAEIDFSIAATLIVTGVPLGCTLKAFNANGTVLEEVRNEVWHKAAPVMFTVPATQISSITVTRPSSTTRWLHFELYLGTAPPLQNGDVYALYPEA